MILVQKEEIGLRTLDLYTISCANTLLDGRKGSHDVILMIPHVKKE